MIGKLGIAERLVIVKLLVLVHNFKILYKKSDTDWNSRGSQGDGKYFFVSKGNQARHILQILNGIY